MRLASVPNAGMIMISISIRNEWRKGEKTYAIIGALFWKGKFGSYSRISRFI